MEANQSEVARIRNEIELTCQAMREGLNGFSQAGAHFIVRLRYHTLEGYTNQLATHVGDEQATDELTRIYNKVVG